MHCKSGPVRLPQSSGERRLEKKNDLHFCKSLIFKWYHQESNRGHKDFQSFALPTELWHLVLVRSGNISFAVAKVVKLLDSASLMEIKNTDKKLVG